MSFGRYRIFRYRILKRPFLWPELYRSPGRAVNSRFCLMKNPLLYRSDSAGEQSGGARKVPYRAARSNSERAAPSACVGKLLRSFGLDRLDAPGHAAARGWPRWLRILTITGGSSMAAMIFKALDTQRLRERFVSCSSSSSSSHRTCFVTGSRRPGPPPSDQAWSCHRCSPGRAAPPARETAATRDRTDRWRRGTAYTRRHRSRAPVA